MSEKFDEAVLFATKAHKGQSRKMSGTPYILHPFEVAGIVATMTGDEDVMIAALLHDTIEDCGVFPEEILEKFGDKVLKLVLSETEFIPSALSKTESWYGRKEESLKRLKGETDLNVKILWLSDKLSNVRSFYREHRVRGDEFFTNLHEKDKKKQAWYYYTIKEYLSELASSSAYEEYSELIDKIFKE